MAHIDNTVSDEVMEKMKWKKEILRAKKLFEATAQVPSPSKDFTQIILTEGSQHGPSVGTACHCA